MLFWPIFENFWCPVVTLVTFSSNLRNFEWNPKNPPKSQKKPEKIPKIPKIPKIQKIQKKSKKFKKKIKKPRKKKTKNKKMSKMVKKSENIKNLKKSQKILLKKSRIWETKHLSTNADSSTDAIGGWTKNTPKPLKYLDWD